MDAVRVLLVTEEGGAERLVRLGTRPVTIGREAPADIRVDSPFVSRLHARIEPRPDGPRLVDLGSRNGTLLNGQLVVEPAPLRVGDVVEIANVRLLCLAAPPLRGATRTYVRHPALGQALGAAEPPGEGGVGEAERSTETEDLAGEVRVDERRREVWVAGRSLARRLSAQEFALLAHLYAHRDRVCTRQELGDAIWGRDQWEANMLHQLVRRLKEKLEPDPAQPRYILTVPQAGYRLTG